ncbi:MAG: signal recognition particle-docking protein FtsY [Coxiella sp. RIFCSPHIGHO2_12_FULL_44_14]|nr:MAG: signal recognition particle-docking protein FtsY [Coxiella sp. RIFCSPHIGHO2_12_FULL_44_14]
MFGLSKSTPPLWFKQWSQGLQRTREHFKEGCARVFLGKKVIDEQLLETLETQLLLADVGVETTQAIFKQLSQRVARKELSDPTALWIALRQTLFAIVEPYQQPLVITETPFVILMVGVNGVGKTTTIAKLTHYWQQQNKKVMLAAGDTFRAAAVEQLQWWGERNQVPVVAQPRGADSAAVIYDALQSAIAKKTDVLIVDTAGRLHTQDNLMSELKKIKRVMQKLQPHAPHETMLVLDAGTGQNAIQQAQQFHEALSLTGITITKLDGTAKGGILFAITQKMQLPIRFIGLGEQLTDLQPFDSESFVNALLAEKP